MGQWCELPDEVLLLITKQLTSIVCFTRFSVVCKSWRSVAINKYNSNHGFLLPQPPWLLQAKPINSKEEEEHLQYYHCYSPCFRFYGLPHDSNSNSTNNTNNIYDSVCEIKIPGAPKQFLGSSGTWLITVDTEKTIHLFNPLSLVELHLPSKTRPGNFELSDRTIGKVVLSCSSSSNSNHPTLMMNNISRDHHDLVAAAVLHYFRLCFVRPGEEAWTVIDQCCQRFHDIIFYKRKLYAVDCSGSVFVCDLSSDRFPPKAEELLIESLSLQPSGDEHGGIDIEYYLVDVLGDLMLVLRFLFYNFGVFASLCRVTRSFKVFKLDFASMKWDMVKSLGRHSIFLGGNASMSILVDSESSSTLVRKNCVYFTGSRFATSLERYNVGVFDMEDGSVQPVYTCAPLHPLPIWMIPT